MIEELTPPVLMASMVLIIVTAPVITLALCALLLWRYRRAVTKAMAVAGNFATATTTEGELDGRADAAATSPRSDSEALAQRAIRAPSFDALVYGIAVLAGALVFALAAQRVYSFDLGVTGYFVGVWIYLWPAVLAIPWIVPCSIRQWLALVTAYLIIYALLGLWASTVMNVPGLYSGAVMLIPPRSSVTPYVMARLWLTVNATPTLLALLCFNRRVRAVAPLVLCFVTLVITGLWFALVFAEQLIDLSFGWLDADADLPALPLLLAMYLLIVVMLGVTGWVLARATASAYRCQKLSDRSLILDALWLIFACIYSMWLLMGGFVLLLALPVAFFFYKLVLATGAKLRSKHRIGPRGLAFLRVFSLGRRSETLLDAVSKYWRHIGSVQIITGPDVARSTVQPHHFLDFLMGKLSRYFVHDGRSLERSLLERDFERDPDGRYRINSLFCREDSWQPALPRLVEEGGTVLMDLRSFSAENSGCIHELEFLARNVPFKRCLLLVDETTDQRFLEEVVTQACGKLGDDSPNYAYSFDKLCLHHFGSDARSLPELVRRLCDAAAPRSAKTRYATPS